MLSFPPNTHSARNNLYFEAAIAPLTLVGVIFPQFITVAILRLSVDLIWKVFVNIPASGRQLTDYRHKRGRTTLLPSTVVQPRYIINNANLFPVQTVDRATQWINLFPVDNVIGLANFCSDRVDGAVQPVQLLNNWRLGKMAKDSTRYSKTKQSNKCLKTQQYNCSMKNINQKSPFIF